MKLLHASDFHLDSPLSGLPPEKSAQRRRELREIPARLAQLAKDEGVDLVLLPGDLFDGDRVYPETVQALAQALADMAVPVFIAPGNHDYYHERSPYARSWPDNVHIFTRPTLEPVDLPGLNCVVHGCAFTAPHREDDPLAGFAAPGDGRLHLLCLHGEAGVTAGNYAPIAPESLEHSGAAYAALGHIHAINSGKEGQTQWAYPGCPEGRGFDELGPKGALIVSFGGDARPAAGKFVPLCKRQYRIETVNVNNFTSDMPLGGCPDLVRFVLTGESRTAPDLTALAAQAAPHFFHVELRDQTAIPQDLWARADEDSLTGLFLREMRARMDGADEARRDKLLLATRFGLAALEGREDVRP